MIIFLTVSRQRNYDITDRIYLILVFWRVAGSLQIRRRNCLRKQQSCQKNGDFPIIFQFLKSCCTRISALTFIIFFSSQCRAYQRAALKISRSLITRCYLFNPSFPLFCLKMIRTKKKKAKRKIFFSVPASNDLYQHEQMFKKTMTI